MTTQNLALFKGMGAKMQYLTQRQTIISQNIANSDTPGYQPRDLTAVDFNSILDTIARKSDKSGNITMQKSSAGHMTKASSATPEGKEQRQTYEVAPAGNAVIMEEQMIKSQETIMDYNLITSLYQKNVGMLKTAIGSN